MSGCHSNKHSSTTRDDLQKPRRGSRPSSIQPKRRVCRTVSLALLFGSMLAGSLPGPTPALAETTPIRTPADARRLGLESLRLAVQRDGGVPLPSNLEQFVKDRETAVQLGKALFWDMQLGSDGLQACASCHFHAGADNRPRNALNPNLLTIAEQRQGDISGYFTAPTVNDNFRFETRQPNATLTREDFPFVKVLQELNPAPNGTVEPGTHNSNDIAGSMGMLFTLFTSIRPGFRLDAGTPQHDTVWNINGSTSVRRVEPRNTPTVINAVFNFTNFWEGRANPHFNGVNAFGDQDATAAVVVNQPGAGLAFERIALDNASLASQALSPLTSAFEMSFAGRSLPEIGVKLLRPSPRTGVPLTPLGLQQVHRRDSVLGPLSKAPLPGLSTSYEALIKQAFVEKYWDSTEAIETPSLVFTQMEFNFSLFFGLAVALYEATLVADQSPFDQWMERGHFNRGFGQQALAGLNLFVNQGQCLGCHAGPELTSASVRHAKGGTNLIGAIQMPQGAALFDTGFFNTSVTPTTDDVGRGGADAFGQPLAFARQALFDRLGMAKSPFPILGHDSIPARDEAQGNPVCTDTNANGVCDPSETILPAFQRVAVDGAFKTPGLRNVELTGPYFHNGGVATLRQVVQFYNRGGNFCDFNGRDLHPRITPLGLSQAQEEQLVAFLVSLTDKRVRYQQAPFDHPELIIPEDGLDTVVLGTRTLEAVGVRGARYPLSPFLDLAPQDAIYTPVGVCAQNPAVRRGSK